MKVPQPCRVHTAGVRAHLELPPAPPRQDAGSEATEEHQSSAHLGLGGALRGGQLGFQMQAAPRD